MSMTQAPSHTIVDLVRGSKAYLQQRHPRHLSETLPLVFDDLVTEVRIRTAPRHRKEDSKPKHLLWSIDQK